MQPIMIQIRDRQWTISALHLACAIARNEGCDIVLMRMQQVQHIAWLGTNVGYESPTVEEYRLLDDFAATAEDYGVKVTLQVFQYMTLPEALAEAADYIDARLVFATLPNYSLPYWRKFQLWRLQTSLSRQNRQLFTLDDRAETPSQTPYIVVLPTPTRKNKARSRVKS